MTQTHPIPLVLPRQNETDPDYLCQQVELDNGTPAIRYRWAFHDAFERVEEKSLDGLAAFMATPLGGYRPLPQARKFHRSRKRFRSCLGGNRSSKSHSLAVETLWLAMRLHPFRPDLTIRPAVGWWATTTFEKVADTLWEKFDPNKNGLLLGIESIGFAWDIVWRSKQHSIPRIVKIILPGNVGASEIHFKAYEQGRESFQAAALDFAHFDEQYTQDIFVETSSRIGPGKEMNFACALTPLNPDPWLEDRTSINVPDSDDVFYFPLDDNRESLGGFIADERIDAVIENWPPETRETRRRGRWGSYEGSIFQTFAHEIHVVDPEKERRLFWQGREFVPPQIVSYGAIDWGGNNPFVFLWGARIPWLDNDWYIYDEYYWNFKAAGPRRLEQHADEIKSRTKDVWRTTLDRIWADHDPTDAYEFANYGLISNPANKSSVKAGIECMQTLFNPRKHLANDDFPHGRPRLHIAQRCVMTVQQIKAYHWDPSASPDRRDPKDAPAKVNDHTCDAARYLVFSEKPYETPEELPAEASYSQYRPKYARTF